MRRSVQIEDYNRLWQKARDFATRRGFGDEAEDFASDLVQRKLEGKSQRQTLEQSFISYCDALRANKRVLGSPHGYCSKGLVESFDKPLGSDDDDGPSIGDLIGMPGDDMELRSEFREIARLADRIIGLAKLERRIQIKRIYEKYLEDIE